jgi:hypothetical protein
LSLASTVQGVFAAKGSGTDSDLDFISEAPLNRIHRYKMLFNRPEWTDKIISKNRLAYSGRPDSSHIKEEDSKKP